MEAVKEGGEENTAPKGAGCLRSGVGVALGLALGALAGIVVGLVVGVSAAMILGLL